MCGILAGRDQTVERVFRVRNMAEEIDADSGVFRDRDTGVAAAGRRRVHYYMDPKDQLHVYNEIDELGLDPIGYYHSHPQSEARPSSTDIRLATDTTTFYILISLAGYQRTRRARLAHPQGRSHGRNRRGARGRSCRRLESTPCRA